MELVFSRKDMMAAMKMVTRAAGKSTALPVLSSVLISAAQDPLWNILNKSGSNGGDGIYLAATDLETGIRTSIPGRIMHDGAIALPARTFADVISALAEDDVKLVATNGKARIQSENGEFKIAGISADEFPSLMGQVNHSQQMELTEQPADEKGIDFLSLNSDALGCMVRKTAFAASRDDARYFLNGVCLSLKSEGGDTLVRMAATDGTRLAVASMMIEQSIGQEMEAIIPIKAVRELEKLTVSSKPSDEIKIGIQEDRVIFDAGDTALVSRLVEGEYPDYQKAIPAGSVINLEVDTEHLLAAARRMSQVANPKLPCVRLELEGNRMKVSASSTIVGDGHEEMNVDNDGDDMTIAVNVHYLMDALRVMDTQNTLIGIDSAVKPMVIRPTTGDHLCVLMPVRLADG